MLSVQRTSDRLINIPGAGLQAYGGAAEFLPTDISGLQIWLKADAIVGLADGDPLPTWEDSSVENHDATAPGATQRPLYKTAIKNGLPVVRFDGINDMLNGSVAALGDLTVFAAVKSTNWLSVSGIDSWAFSFGAFDPEVGAHSAAANRRPSVYDDGYRDFTDLLLQNNVWSLLSFWRTSGGYNCALNGAASSSNPITHSFSNTATTFSLANQSGTTGGQWIGDMAEIIVYSSSLSTANRQAVESYLNSKWAIY